MSAASPPAQAPAAHIASHYARTVRPGDALDEGWPALAGETEAHVCVAGGGLAGLTAALGLAERGKSVVLLEARRVAWGASGRNGGFVGQGFAADSETLLERLGPHHARRLYELSREGVALVRERIARHAIPCAPVDGWLRVSRRDRPGALARKRDLMATAFGVELEHWPREEVRAALASEAYYDGLLDPLAFHLQPLTYALALARAAAAAGVRLFEGSAVTGIDGFRTGGGSVATAGGRVRAGSLVIACGGYASGLPARLGRGLVPVATYIVVTEPLGAALAEAIRVPHAISDTRRAYDYYRALPEGRLLWGGRMTAGTRAPARLAELLLRDMARVYPQLGGARAESAWSGLMGYAFHQMPQIGRLAPGRPDIWHCTGFGGHGLNTTAIAGELVARAIAEGDDRHRLFQPFGRPPTFGPLGAAAAQASYWWCQLRDAVG